MKEGDYLVKVDGNAIGGLSLPLSLAHAHERARALSHTLPLPFLSPSLPLSLRPLALSRSSQFFSPLDSHLFTHPPPGGSCTGKNMYDLSKKLLGAEGSKVQLHLQRAVDGTSYSVNITRKTMMCQQREIFVVICVG